MQPKQQLSLACNKKPVKQTSQAAKCQHPRGRSAYNIIYICSVKSSTNQTIVSDRSLRLVSLRNETLRFSPERHLLSVR